MWEECIRCNEAPAVDDQGYCGHCHWAVRAEVEEGFYAMREYLRAWARFDEWCETQKLAAWFPELLGLCSAQEPRRAAGVVEARYPREDDRDEQRPPGGALGPGTCGR